MGVARGLTGGGCEALGEQDVRPEKWEGRMTSWAVIADAGRRQHLIEAGAERCGAGEQW